MTTERRIEKEYLLFILIMLGVIIYMVLTAFDFRFRSGIMPILIGIPTIFLLLILVVDCLFPHTLLSSIVVTGSADIFDMKKLKKDVLEKVRKDKKPTLTQEVKKDKGKLELITICWLLALVLLLYIFGFLLAIPIFLFFIIYLHTRFFWPSLFYTAAAWLMIYVIFVVLMKVRFFPGILF